MPLLHVGIQCANEQNQTTTNETGFIYLFLYFIIPKISKLIRYYVYEIHIIYIDVIISTMLNTTIDRGK